MGPDCGLRLFTYQQVRVPIIFESLEPLLASACTHDSIVLLGDLNAHVGKDSETWKRVTGKPPRSERGWFSVIGYVCYLQFDHN